MALHWEAPNEAQTSCLHLPATHFLLQPARTTHTSSELPTMAATGSLQTRPPGRPSLSLPFLLAEPSAGCPRLNRVK